MHIECFKYFYEVAILKSISKAAANSHISQSALSQQLQKLEDRIGVKLLERSNKGVELTTEGKIVLRHCETIINSYERMLEDVSSLRLYNHNIRIDAYWTASSYLMPLVMFNLKKRFENYDIKLTSNDNENIQLNIMNGISDIGICYDASSNESLISSKVTSDKLILVASPEFEINSSLCLKELSNYPMIILNDKLNIKHSLYTALSKVGKNLNDLDIIFSVDSIETAKASVERGYGVSILPYLAVKNELEKNSLKEVNLQGLDFKYSIYMVYAPDTSKNFRDFIDYFKKQMKRITQ